MFWEYIVNTFQEKATFNWGGLQRGLFRRDKERFTWCSAKQDFLLWPFLNLKSVELSTDFLYVLLGCWVLPSKLLLARSDSGSITCSIYCWFEPSDYMFLSVLWWFKPYCYIWPSLWLFGEKDKRIFLLFYQTIYWFLIIYSNYKNNFMKIS